MYLIKASVKSNGLNAFVSGLGPTKRYCDVGYGDGAACRMMRC